MVVCNAHPAFAQNLWLEINEARANKRPLSFSKEKEKKKTIHKFTACLIKCSEFCNSMNQSKRTIYKIVLRHFA